MDLEKLKEKFKSKCSDGPIHNALRTKCILWNGGKDRFGYGYFYFPKQCARAHRAAWVLFVGEIPSGECVLHKCDVPACVNPDHLFIGSRRDNVDDMIRKGRHINVKMTKDMVAQIMEEKPSWDRHSASRLSEKLGICKAHIRDIANGRRMLGERAWPGNSQPVE